MFLFPAAAVLSFAGRGSRQDTPEGRASLLGSGALFTTGSFRLRLLQFRTGGAHVDSSGPGPAQGLLQRGRLLHHLCPTAHGSQQCTVASSFPWPGVERLCSKFWGAAAPCEELPPVLQMADFQQVLPRWVGLHIKDVLTDKMPAISRN